MIPLLKSVPGLSTVKLCCEISQPGFSTLGERRLSMISFRSSLIPWVRLGIGCNNIETTRDIQVGFATVGISRFMIMIMISYTLLSKLAILLVRRFNSALLACHCQFNHGPSYK